MSHLRFLLVQSLTHGNIYSSGFIDGIHIEGSNEVTEVEVHQQQIVIIMMIIFFYILKVQIKTIKYN